MLTGHWMINTGYWMGRQDQWTKLAAFFMILEGMKENDWRLRYLKSNIPFPATGICIS
jgi:hypothetical protein